MGFWVVLTLPFHLIAIKSLVQLEPAAAGPIVRLYIREVSLSSLSQVKRRNIEIA